VRSRFQLSSLPRSPARTHPTSWAPNVVGSSTDGFNHRQMKLRSFPFIFITRSRDVNSVSFLLIFFFHDQTFMPPFTGDGTQGRSWAPCCHGRSSSLRSPNPHNPLSQPGAPYPDPSNPRRICQGGPRLPPLDRGLLPLQGDWGGENSSPPSPSTWGDLTLRSTSTTTGRATRMAAWRCLHLALHSPKYV